MLITVDKCGPRCHFVWIGDRLPYFARLAIESALLAMPGASVELHYVGAPAAGEHARAVATNERVTVAARSMGDYFEASPTGSRALLEVVARVPHASPATISNLVRLAVLHAVGGIYFDTDVFVIRGLDDPIQHGSYVGHELVWRDNREWVARGSRWAVARRSVPWGATRLARRADSRLLGGGLRLAERLPEGAQRLQVNNAVIGAPAGACFLRHALERALTVDPSERFALGPSLLDDVARKHPTCVRIVPPSRFYPVPPGQSYRLFEDWRVELPVDTQVVHYVSSNHRGLLRDLEPTDQRFTTGEAQFWWLGQRVQEAAR